MKLQKKWTIIILFIILIAFALLHIILPSKNCFANTISGYTFDGINNSNNEFDGIEADISYANPTLAAPNDFSSENISLVDNDTFWVEVGWVKDPNKKVYSTEAFFENIVATQQVYYYPISQQTHNYKVVFVGRRADYNAVFRFYLDNNLMYGAGLMGPQYLRPEAKGEVYNSTNRYSDMGPANISNLKLRYSGEFSLWKNQYPTLNTNVFTHPPYRLIFFNLFYHFANNKE